MYFIIKKKKKIWLVNQRPSKFLIKSHQSLFLFLNHTFVSHFISTPTWPSSSFPYTFFFFIFSFPDAFLLFFFLFLFFFTFLFLLSFPFDQPHFQASPTSIITPAAGFPFLAPIAIIGSEAFNQFRLPTKLTAINYLFAHLLSATAKFGGEGHMQTHIRTLHQPCQHF